MAEPYQYKPLQSGHHIRLIQVTPISNDDETETQYTYSIIHKELPLEHHVHLDFEAISYTWGSPERVSTITLTGDGDGGVPSTVGLTRNLTEALPYLSKHSRTAYLWIDQICINQTDNAEKATQIALMSRIYAVSSRVIVWLGVENEHTPICKLWLSKLNELMASMPNAERMTPGTPEYKEDIRYLVVRSTFSSEATDPMYAPAIAGFWARRWFTRAWIVQEFLLTKSTLILVGDTDFSLQNLADLIAIPPGHPANPSTNGTGKQAPDLLMTVKLHPFTDPQPRRWLRLMANVTSEFETMERCDNLYSLLGMIPEVPFAPDYSQSIRVNYTRFAALIAKHLGSLDFLSLWDANLNPIVPSTPEELLGFASWVPSYWWVPLSAPYRLAVGGVRSLRGEVHWDACAGRKHVYDQQGEGDAQVTERLVVRGQIVDHISHIADARFIKYWDADEDYLSELVGKIKNSIPGVDDWGVKEMIMFLYTASLNGEKPGDTYEEIMGIKKKMSSEVRDIPQYNEALSLCLSVGRGRRFVGTKGGRLGLVPFIGTKPGTAIVIFHGCCVPLVLERVDDDGREWRVLGDCYFPDLMFGEGLEWPEAEAQTFVLA